MSTDCGSDLSLLVAFIAGLLSLLGAFAGAALGRRSDHIKWLRERQSEVFSKFLEQLQKARHQAVLYKLSPEFDPESSDDTAVKVAGFFSDAMIYSRIVRLYLPDQEKEPFSNFVKEYWHACSKEKDITENSKLISNTLNSIQAIFEAQLRA